MTLRSKLTDKAAKPLRKAVDKARGGVRKVPGPSPNAATNLLIADVAVRGASMLFRRSMEKGLLRARFDRDEAREIIEGRPVVRSAISFGLARLATRSVPGLLVVTGGLVAKTIVDRGLGRRKAREAGDKQLTEDAENARDA